MDSDVFRDFCGGHEFWNTTALIQDQPEVSSCFEETVLLWVPYGFPWVAILPYIAFLSQRGKDPVLPWTKLLVSKTSLNVVLICLSVVELALADDVGHRCRAGIASPPSVYVGGALKLASYILVLIIHFVMKSRGIQTSGVPFTFWLAAAVASIIPLYGHAIAEVWCGAATVDAVEFGILWIQLFLNCFADQYDSTDNAEIGMGKCPEENASVINRMTYSWVFSLVVTAYKRTLTSNDLWQQTKRLRSSLLIPKLLRKWRKAEISWRTKHGSHRPYIEYARYKTNGKSDEQSSNEQTPLLNNGLAAEQGGVDSLIFASTEDKTGEDGPSLYFVVVKTFGWLWVEAALYKLIGDGFNLLQPVLLQQIIGLIEARDDPTKETLPQWVGYALTVALLCTSMLKSLFFHCTFNHMIVLGMSMKTAFIGAIYRKALSMSNTSRKSFTVGQIVNLMSVDCQRIQDAFTFSHYIISLPFTIAIAMVQIYMLMGVYAMVGGLLVVFAATALNGLLGRLQQTLQRQILSFKGSRIKILNEVINGIKVLKMYTWEKSFEQKVLSIRNEELKRLRKYAIYAGIAIMLAVHSPFMVNYVLVLIYTLTSAVHYLDAQTAFVVLSLVNILRGPILITPFFITGIIQGYVSIGRIQRFLWNDDINDGNVQYINRGDYAIKVNNGRFTWDRKVPRPTLDKITLRIKEGQLFAVVGQVGCGKSSLISAILGEMEKINGGVTIKGSVAYVPQEAWIQNLTVRDNILFGNVYDNDRYNKVLSGCALLPDLKILSGGDMTEIGEKGINISGGQKQRVSLARAVYNNADIYLLDDPLSAVDSHVGKHLFRNVIGNEGLLKHKTRLLVTHGIHWLPMVDNIIVLTDGRISEMGTYEELIKRNGPFAQFLQSYVDKDDESDAEDNEVLQMKERVLSDIDAVTSDDNDTATERRRRRRVSSNREKSFGMSFSKDKGVKSADQKEQAVSRLVKEEESQKGAVKLGVFVAYAKAMGLVSVLLICIFMIAFQSLNVFSNYWLTFWTEDPILKNVSNGHTQEYEDTFVYYLVSYTIIGVVQGFAIASFGILSMTRMVKASGILHKKMLTCVLRSPMSFFDTTPIGRIVNRFSSDIDIMDDRLPLTFRLWNIQIFSTFATIIVVSINTPPFMAVIVPMFIVYMLLLKFFLPTARQVKRLESVLRSPIYNHFSETITGVSVIRAYKCSPRFIMESERRVDTNIKFFFAAISAARWIGVRLEVLGNILIFAAAIFALLAEGLNVAEVGLSITYALQITINLNLVVQAVSEMEMNIVSAERVKEYTELSPEAPWVIESYRPPNGWPTKGDVDFNQYTTRYRPGLDLVLKGIACNIRTGEKVGIVGRTGAGKSSLTLSLFRLIEAAGGNISIDGVKISDIGLHDLRSKLTILPQDPVLFSGSLRMNLDPFNRFNDDEIWRSLESAHLRSAVERMPNQLLYECGEGGNNLSIGQRQLVCLARTLLHKTRILILDEATAAVDLETDDLIQATIRTQFADCTILTIAHRLNTILDYDRVIVMDGGLIKEFDQPSRLLQDKSTMFYGMAKDAGLVS